MRSIGLPFLLVFFFSCDTKTKTAKSMNAPSKPVSVLESSVINKGDSTAYYELFLSYLDNNKQNTDFMYYAYAMAFKYNYPKAYLDLFEILCNLNHIELEGQKVDLRSMDTVTRNLAVECIRRAAQMNYLNSRELLSGLVV